MSMCENRAEQGGRGNARRALATMHHEARDHARTDYDSQCKGRRQHTFSAFWL